MNDVYPQAWLADVLARSAEHPARRRSRCLHRYNLRDLVNIKRSQRMDYLDEALGTRSFPAEAVVSRGE